MHEILQKYFNRADAALVLLLSVPYFIVALATISDYGVGWDVCEMFIGDRNLRFYQTLDPDYLDYGKKMPIPEYGQADHPDFDEVVRAENFSVPLGAPHEIWPVGPLTASLTNKIFYSGLGWMGAIESRHFAPVLWFWVLLVALYVFMRIHAGTWEAVFTVVALATYPRLLAHSHFNIKDVPSCAMFTLVALSFYVGCRRRRWRWITLSAALWGVGLATKANMLFLPFILAPWFAAMVLRRDSKKGRFFTRPLMASLVSYPMVGLLLAAVCWPYLMTDFPHRISVYLSYLIKKGYENDHGWHSGPLLHWVSTMPVACLVLMVPGVYLLFKRRHEPRLRGLGLLLLIWVVVTITRVSMPSAVDYDGIRHWLEILLPTCILVGLSGGWLVQKLRATLLRPLRGGQRTAVPVLLTVLIFAPVTVWNIRNHPHQVTYYNGLIGGLAGAQEMGLKDSTDYWGISTRSAMRWFNQHAEHGAAILPLIGAHHFHYTQKVWLRSDLKLIPANALSKEEVRRHLDQHQGPLYICYITRRWLYTPEIRRIDEHSTPVKTFAVDGAPIFKIFRRDQIAAQRLKEAPKEAREKNQEASKGLCEARGASREERREQIRRTYEEWRRRFQNRVVAIGDKLKARKAERRTNRQERRKIQREAMGVRLGELKEFEGARRAVRLHAWRAAKLERLEDVARAAGIPKCIKRIEALEKKNDEQLEKRLAKLEKDSGAADEAGPAPAEVPAKEGGGGR